MTQATAALDQCMTIEHGMDGAFGWDGDVGESAEEALANLACAPAGVLTLHVQNIVFHLEGKLVGIAIGTPASIGQSLYPAFLVAVEDFVAGLARDSKLRSEEHTSELQSLRHLVCRL